MAGIDVADAGAWPACTCWLCARRWLARPQVDLSARPTGVSRMRTSTEVAGKPFQRALAVSQPGASNLLRTLVQHGIVREVGEGPGVRHRWFGDELLKILDAVH